MYAVGCWYHSRRVSYVASFHSAVSYEHVFVFFTSTHPHHACMHERTHERTHARTHARARAHTHTHTRQAVAYMSYGDDANRKELEKLGTIKALKQLARVAMPKQVCRVCVLCLCLCVGWVVCVCLGCVSWCFVSPRERDGVRCREFVSARAHFSPCGFVYRKH